MIIKNARFVTSLSAFSPFEGQGIPEIAMAGKSNVGKSSLINALCNNKKLARTSGEPGKTRLINLYRVNDEFFLVDLPGYGFARAPKGEKLKWAGMIEQYLEGSEHIKHVLQLVDIRHDPTEDDKIMVNYLRHYDIPITVIATKSDKISGAKRTARIHAIARTLGVQPWEIVPFSSVTGFGKEKVLEALDGALG